MAEKKAGSFEAAIDRLEQIVKELEAGDVSLDDSVRLYREGRELARKCEQLLRTAQEEVEAAGRSAAAPAPASAAATADESLPF
jgi:exodeoxyribonuclease VII small subunit